MLHFYLFKFVHVPSKIQWNTRFVSLPQQYSKLNIICILTICLLHVCNEYLMSKYVYQNNEVI